MKYLLLSLLLCLSTLSASYAATHAATAPSLLPISEGARKAFLLSSATTATLRYVGDGVVSIPNHTGEATVTTANQSSGTPAAMLASLSSMRVSIGIANPHRPVRAICEIKNSLGTILLSGETPAEVVADPRASGGYKINQVAPIILEPSANIPVVIPNAELIEIVSRDAEGNLEYTDTVYPDENGVFDVWTWSHRFGEMIVRFNDGSKAFYSLTTGERVQESAVIDSKVLVLPNYVERSVTTGSTSVVQTVSMTALYEKWNVPSPPTFRIKVGVRTKLRIQVTCKDSDGFAVIPPTEWWYHRDDDIDEFMVPEFETYNHETGIATFIINVTPGVYWINAEGQEFRRTYWGPDGGKG